MKIQTLAALLLVLGLTAAGCSGGGGSSEAASKVDDGGTGLETPVTPIVDVPPVVIAPVPIIAIDQGIVATSDPLLALAFDRPGMQQMKISFNSDCSGGTWESFSETRSLALQAAQLNSRVDISVKFIDAELFESDCFSSSILHDNIPPVVKVDASVPAVTNNISQTIAFHAEDTGAGVSELYCQIPGQTSATPCAGLYDGHLADGGYVVQLLAADNAGNLSGPTAISFTVDMTPPTVLLNSTPPSISSSTTGRFEFSGADNLSGVQSFECKMDSATVYSPCVSGQVFSGLAQGTHTFVARALDVAGNASSVASYAWTIDSTAPTLRFTQTPASVTNASSATFAFVGQESDGTAISHFECRLDSGAFVSCNSPKINSGLTEGRHTFGVRGTSRAGIVSAELTYSWSVDLTAPVVTIASGPAALNNSTAANFTYSASDAFSGVASVTCRLDSGAEKDCASMVQAYAGLTGDSQHSFQVTVTDQAGNQAVSAPYLWYVDRTLPTLTITSVPAALTAQTVATFQMSGGDDHGSVTFQCKLDGAVVFTNCSSTVNYSNIVDGTHTFSAQARDQAGNISPVSSYTWTVDTVGPVIAFTRTPNDTILTTDQGVLAYTISDTLSRVVSANCSLDAVVTACSTASATLTFPKLPVGGHTFSLTATNAAGISTTRSYTFNVQPFCSTTLSTTTVPTKMLFITDMSGSNQSASGCALGPNCTDEGKKMRAGSIQQFFTDYKAHANFSWGFDVFQGSSSSALINSGSPTSPIFSTAPAMQSAMTAFKNMSDSGSTPYMAALKLGTTLIANDPDLKAAGLAQYIIVFMSDGMPNGTGDTAVNIINQVKAIMALAPGRVSFNAVYYGPVNKTASDLLQSMATSGNGNFLNTNTNPTGLSFLISDLVNVPVTTCQ